MDDLVSDSETLSRIKSLGEDRAIEIIEETKDSGRFYAKLGILLMTVYVLFVTIVLVIVGADSIFRLVFVMFLIEICGAGMIWVVAHLIPTLQSRRSLHIFKETVIVKDQISGATKSEFVKDVEGNRNFRVTMITRDECVFFPNSLSAGSFYIDDEYIGSYDSRFLVYDKLEKVLNS